MYLDRPCVGWQLHLHRQASPDWGGLGGGLMVYRSHTWILNMLSLKRHALNLQCQVDSRP